jgi:hypothetical protein
MHKRLLILTILFIPNFSYASAWLQAKGMGQIINTTSLYLSNSYYDHQGDKQDSGVNFRKGEFSTFAEYGMTDDWTLGGNLSLQDWNFKKKTDLSQTIFDFRQCGLASQNNVENEHVSIVEMELFARKKLWQQDNFILSIQPLIKSPCMVISGGGPQFVNNTADVELRTLAGYGFKWDNDDMRIPFAGQQHFVDFELAYRKRGGQFADQLKLDSTLGLRASKKVLFLAQIFSTISVGDEPVRGVIGNNQLYLEKDSFYSVKAQISGITKLKDNRAVQISLFSEVLGKNSGQGNGVSFSIWYGF